MNPDLAIPSGLSPEGQKAAEIILAFLKANDLTYTGGCRVFYSLEEWADLDHDVGHAVEAGALLIVASEGAACRDAFDPRNSWRLQYAMRNVLRAEDMHSDKIASWSSAIY